MEPLTLVGFSLCLIALMLNLLLVAFDIDEDETEHLPMRVAWTVIYITAMIMMCHKSYCTPQPSETPAPAAVSQYETESGLEELE